MKERPILFNGAMVRAILEGRKTHTRRIVKGMALDWLEASSPEYVADPEDHLCPLGAPGDRLWVRETWSSDDGKTAHYRADGETYNAGLPWRPSIHMPRWASRITLEITGVRVERLQEITEEGAKAEGCSPCGFAQEVALNPAGGCSVTDLSGTSRGTFRMLWDSIYKGSKSWDANPWVWDIEFRVAERRDQ